MSKLSGDKGGNETPETREFKGKIDRSATERLRVAMHAQVPLAIAIDTCIYQSTNFDLEGASFRDLADLVESARVSVVEPYVWAMEVQKHLREHVKAKFDGLLKPLREGKHADQTGLGVILEQVLVAVNASKSVDIASARLKTHRAKLAIEHLPVADSCTSQVLSMYFACKYPFENNDEKRKEFPDAFALLTLELFAEERHRCVVVVSRDVGCLKYCETSPKLIGFSTLDGALAALRTQPEVERLLAFQKVLEPMLSDPTSNLFNALAGSFPDLDRVVLDRLSMPDTSAPHISFWRMLTPFRLMPVGPNGSLINLNNQRPGEAHFSGVAVVPIQLSLLVNARNRDDGTAARRELEFTVDLEFAFHAEIRWEEGEPLDAAKVVYAESNLSHSAKQIELPEMTAPWEILPFQR